MKGGFPRGDVTYQNGEGSAYRRRKCGEELIEYQAGGNHRHTQQGRHMIPQASRTQYIQDGLLPSKYSDGVEAVEGLPRHNSATKHGTDRDGRYAVDKISDGIAQLNRKIFCPLNAYRRLAHGALEGLALALALVDPLEQARVMGFERARAWVHPVGYVALLACVTQADEASRDRRGFRCHDDFGTCDHVVALCVFSSLWVVFVTPPD